ncbi:peptidoglycan recognition protein 1-like [Dermacentor andersoni]|uniref:peptidoglycan recognition protein 1-like n=1 Tax=Dermacentor andersoni TaxID=34620 RepID=UPI003B3A9023
MFRAQATTIVIVAALLGYATPDERRPTSYRLAGPTSYGYPDWHQGPSGALWPARLPDDEIRATLACSGIEFVPRYAWGARLPKLRERLKVQPVPRVFVHHTAGGECFDPWTCSEWMRYIQHFHMDARGWYDIGYSFLIGGDGRVYVARGWDAVGAHTKGHNEDALAVAFFGDFSRHLPTPEAIRTLDGLLECGVAMGKIRANYTLHGHRDAACRVSPGDALYAFLGNSKHYGGRLKKYICEKPRAYERDVPTRS